MDVDFYTLERPVQDRFSDATRSIGVPTPIVREPPVERGSSYWFAAAAFILAGFVGWVLRGFGSLESAKAIVPLPFAAGYALLAGAVAFCLLRAAALRNSRATLPYQPGLYLFPAGVFDARTERLRVFRHPELRGAAVDGRSIRVTAEGGEFVLRLPTAESAGLVLRAFESGREQFEQATQSANRREQAMLDPLVDSGFSSPFSPQLRLLRGEPLWAKLGPALGLAIVLGAWAGPAVWKARNVLSERRIYAAARGRDTASAYRAYLARGGARRDVSDILLPRGELRKALADGTVEALERFADAHPASKIQAEIQAALHAVIQKELAVAELAGTVTALREFREKRARYPFIAAPVEAATIGIYRGLLRGFSAERDPVAVSFFERLLGYSKVHGPKVTLQFVRRLPESVQAADLQVTRSAYFMGKQSNPSQYFTGDYAERREKAALDRIAAVISEPFPRDVLAVEAAPTITDPGVSPVPSGPTLLIEYSPEMAGGYMSPKPRGVFVGVGMTFKATFSIPGDSQPLEYKSSQWRTPNPLILKLEGTTVADVYERMAADGFDKFTKGFAVLLSGKP
jgi:hypothetical protein